MPDYSGSSQTVIKSGICLKILKQRKCSIFTAAIHPNMTQSLHGLCLGILCNKSRNILMVKKIMIHVAYYQKRVCVFNLRFSSSRFPDQHCIVNKNGDKHYSAPNKGNSRDRLVQCNKRPDRCHYGL